jgi:two-component system OmpR family response regulator
LRRGFIDKMGFSLKILIVDDDPATLLVASMALQYSGGFEVLLASSGTDALECARENHPDAILMDVVMHDLDGLSVLSKLRDEEKTGKIPVIFHTARTNPTEVKRLLSLGAKGVIGKPANPLQLGNEIHRILALENDFPKSA